MKNLDIFISHTNEDADWCEQLAERLHYYGLEAYLEKWQMLDDKEQTSNEEEQISSAKRQTPKTEENHDLITTIERGLARSFRVALVLTPTYLKEKRNWITAERSFPACQMRTGHRDFAIPLLLKDCKLPPSLREFKCLDFRDPVMYQSNLEQLVAILKEVSIDNNMPLSLGLTDTVHAEKRNRERIVTIGGTFDTLHKGHKDYIRLAFEFADRVFIYVSSDEYVKGKKDHPVLSYERRVDRLKDFIQEIEYKKRYDTQSFSNLEQLEIDYLKNDGLLRNIYMAIVPPEYYDFFLKLNVTRQACGMKSFLILVKMRTRDKSGDISASMIRYHSAEK